MRKLLAYNRKQLVYGWGGPDLGLEPPHLRGRLCIGRATTNNLTHDRGVGQAVGVVDILVFDLPWLLGKNGRNRGIRSSVSPKGFLIMLF